MKLSELEVGEYFCFSYDWQLYTDKKVVPVFQMGQTLIRQINPYTADAPISKDLFSDKEVYSVFAVFVVKSKDSLS